MFVYRAVCSINRPHVVAGSRKKVERFRVIPPTLTFACLRLENQITANKQLQEYDFFFLHLSFQSLISVWSERPDKNQFVVTTGSDRVCQ